MHKTVLYSMKIMVVSIMAALCLNSPAFAKKHKKDHQTDNQQSSQPAKADSDKNEQLKKLLEQKKQNEFERRGRRGRFDKLSDEEKARFRKERKERFDRLSDEEKAKIRVKRRERIANMSDEEKARFRKERKERFDRLSDEEKAKIREKRRERIANMSDEEKARFRKEQKERFDKLSDEEKAKIREKRRERIANMSDEEKARFRKERKERFDRLSDKQKERAKEIGKICQQDRNSSECHSQKKAFCKDNPSFCKGDQKGLHGSKYTAGKDKSKFREEHRKKFDVLSDEQKERAKEIGKICRQDRNSSACHSQKKAFCKDNPDFCNRPRPDDQKKPDHTPTNLTNSQKTQIRSYCNTKSDKRSCWKFCKQNPDACVSTTNGFTATDSITATDNIGGTSNSNEIVIDNSANAASDGIVIDTTSSSTEDIVIDNSGISVDDTTTKRSKWMEFAEVFNTLFGKSDSSTNSTDLVVDSNSLDVKAKEESVIIVPEETESKKSDSDDLKDADLDLLNDADLLSENNNPSSENTEESDTSLLGKTSSFFGSVIDGIKNNTSAKGEEDSTQ